MDEEQAYGDEPHDTEQVNHHEDDNDVVLKTEPDCLSAVPP